MQRGEPGGRAVLVLAATSLAAFTATLDNTVVSVALRDIQRELGSSVMGLQGLVTAYTVTLAALLLAGGALVDVLGAKRVLVAGLAVFGGASAGCAGAGSVTALIAWRAVQGAGASLLLPGGLAVLAAAYPSPVARRRALGVWAAVAASALVAGPVVGGELVARHGWPAVFWVNVPLCALVLAAVLPTPATAPAHGRRLDGPGTLLTALVLGTAAYGVVLAGRHGLTSQVLIAVVVVAVASWALRYVERSVQDPVLPSSLLRDRAFRGAMTGAFAAALAVFVLLVFLSLFLELVQEADARATGRVLLALPLAVVAAALVAGRMHAVVAPVAAGLLLAGVGLLGLGAQLHEGTGHGTVQAWLVVVGLGVGLTTAPVVSTALAVAGEGRAGLAAGSVNVARELGGVVAVAGLGALAVARLSARLTTALVDVGVPAGKRQQLLDTMLAARTKEARRLLLQDIGVERALAAAPGIQDRATASFVGSTRLVLQAAGVVLVLLALLSARLLRAGWSVSRRDRGSAG